MSAVLSRLTAYLPTANVLYILIGLAVPLSVFRAPAAAETMSTVAIQPDIPPYVMEKATTGLEVDLVRQALPALGSRFIQLPYADLQTAVQEAKVDVALSVQPTGEGLFYSAAYLTFVNDAISKKADGLMIDRIANLAGHEVLTWQGADLELGDEFESLFSPRSPQRKNYIEFADQREQVRRFWQEKGSVIVIDRSIFRYFSEQTGHSMSDVDLNSIFPAVTNFSAAFKDADLRDRFNRGLAELCKTGEYAKLLERYSVELPHTVCEH